MMRTALAAAVLLVVPGAWNPGDEHYFQALVSKTVSLTTNLMVIEVE
jgi:hypothetical protein